MLQSNELKTLIKEAETKTDGKLDIPKIQKYLSDKLLPMGIPFPEFYKYLMEELTNLLIEINNSIQKNNFFNNNQEILNYYYKAFDIFFSIRNCCINKDTIKIVNENIINDFIQKFINMCFKIISIKETIEDDNDIIKEINKFCEYIYDSFKVLSDININCILQILFLDSKNNFSFLLKQPLTRIILYNILQKILTNNNKQELLSKKEFIIKDIFNFLINEISADNINILFEDIKKLSIIFKNDIILVRKLFLTLIKKVLDLYRKELKNEYENLFDFFFFVFIFEENINENDNKANKFNKDFIEVLFTIYTDLVNDNKKELYNIFLLKFFESINNSSNKEGIIQGNVTKKYSWLLNETEYKKIILDSFPNLYDETSFTFYLAILITLSNESKMNKKKNKIFLPEIDLILFFQNIGKYLNNPNYDKETLINFFMKKIDHLLNNHNKIIKVLLNKCNIFKIMIDLIEEEKDYNIKMKLLEFIEKILSVNKGQFEYNLNIDIKTKIEEIDLRINLISIGYEIYENKYNEKLMKILDIINLCCDKKKINDFLILINLIFKIIVDYQFKKINSLTEKLLLHLNNLLLQMSSIISNSQKDELTNDDKILESYITDYLNSICKFIFQLNMKIFDYKAQKINETFQIFYTRRIIEKKILKNIIKNFILAKNNPNVKKIAFDYLIQFCIDEKNNLILSSYYLYIIINIYYQDKNYKNLQKMFNILYNLVKNFQLNGKILLNYDFVSITIDMLQEIYIKETKDKDEEECYKTGFLFLEEICKFLNQELLIKYLNKLFIIFNKNVLSKIREETTNNENLENLSRNNIGGSIDLYRNSNNSIESYNSKDDGRKNIRFNNMDNIDFENYIPDELNEKEEDINNIHNENDNKSEICLDLFNILKKYLRINSENIYDFANDNTLNYIILSNYTFPNHLINNLLFIDDLKYNNNKDYYLYFRIVLKINTYKEIPELTLLQLRNEKNKIIFKLHKNTLEIKEESLDHKITLYIISNFDKELPADNKYHNLIIVFDTDKKTLRMNIDQKLVINKSNQYNSFNFDSFNMIIGFKNNSVDDNTNNLNNKLINNENKSKIKNINSICFVYISYILILNTLIDEKDLKYFIKKERNYSPNRNLLTHFYREKNSNWAKNIITEIDFQNKNINLIYSKELKKRKVSDINRFFSTNNKLFINQCISYIGTSNPFNDDARNTNLYMISKNKNINEYYSINNFCELERLNKSNINSKIFDNYDLIFNFCNIYIMDFLIGFFFLLEKKIDEIKNKDNKIEYNEKNNKEDESISDLYGDTYLVNEDLIIDYILEIFEILMLIPGEIHENYFVKEDSKSNILKIKFFFYKNISLLNDNDTLIEKILNIFSGVVKQNEEYLNNKKILLEILIQIFLNPIIFGKLNFSIQNTILLFLNDLLKKTGYKKNEEQKKTNYLFKLIKSLILIVLFQKIKLDKDIDGNTQMDYITDCINLILLKLSAYDEKTFPKKFSDFFKKIYNICENFSKEINNHITNEIYKKNDYIFTYHKNYDDFEDNFEEKIEKLCNNIQIFYDLIKKNKTILSIFKENNEFKECSFCYYLKLIFHAKFHFIYDELKFDRMSKKFFRNYYLNFGENSEIFGKKKYAWYLSFKESFSKIQNKLFIKENNIKCFSVQNPKNKKITNYFLYNYGKEYYKKKFKELYELVFIDKISKHKTLIKSKVIVKNQKTIYNCLVINKMHKILSIIILDDEFIRIYYNLCVDNDCKLNIVRSDTTQSYGPRLIKISKKNFVNI